MDVLIGRKLPEATVAELIGGQVTPIKAIDALGKGRVLAIGVPGAFTPVCTEQHVPSLVKNAERLRRSGFDELVCIVASDPFVMQAWQGVIDPEQKVRFVSDGNLELARALGLSSNERKLFLGARSQRYLMTLRGGSIETLRVEKHVADYACTRPEELVIESV